MQCLCRFLLCSRHEKSFADVANFVEVVDLSAFGVEKLSRGAYNSLLKSSHFWSAVPASSVFLTQPDALLIEPLTDDFFKYDYIDAPWSPNRVFSVSFPAYASGKLGKYSEVWQNVVMNQNFKYPVRVGNGGHSIRSVRYMIEMSSLGGSPENEPEDVFLLEILSIILAIFRLFWKPRGFHVKPPIRIRMGRMQVISILSLAINQKSMSAI